MLNEGGTEQEIRKDLETVSAAWERAIVSNDAGAIGQFMTDDWVIVSATGITKKSDFLAAVASGDLTHESFKGTLSRFVDMATPGLSQVACQITALTEASHLAPTSGQPTFL